MDKSEQIKWYNLFHQFQTNREGIWQPKIYSALQRQIKTATSFLKVNGIQATQSRLDTLIRFDEIATIIQNIYIDAGTVFGGKAYQTLKKQTIQTKAMMPIGYNEQLIQEIVRYFQLSLLNEAVMPITETTREYILQTLIRSQQKGLSISDIVKELETTDITHNRARIIARTETSKAANYGAQQSVKKLGVPTLKVWISGADSRVRRLPRDSADHLHMNGITIAIDDDFKVPDKDTGYDLMQRPGDPRGGANQTVNCRCTLGYKVVG